MELRRNETRRVLLREFEQWWQTRGNKDDVSSENFLNFCHDIANGWTSPACF